MLKPSSLDAAVPIASAAALSRCTRQKYSLGQLRATEDHTIGFRDPLMYQEWKTVLHHFYDLFSTVEHYEQAAASIGARSSFETKTGSGSG
jgi:hypothetical protein